MFRTIVLAAAIATLPVLSPVALLGQQAPTNLKVLPKDTSPDQLMKIMHGYTQALGVHCNFCHVVNEATRTPDFASDAKPEKNTARTMMLMTHEINEKYMSQIHDPDAAPDQKTVSCSTCHRGHSMPETFIPGPHGPEHPDMNHPGMVHVPTPPKQ
jgi:hypothetical protein